jgi:hypothetical protein
MNAVEKTFGNESFLYCIHPSQGFGGRLQRQRPNIVRRAAVSVRQRSLAAKAGMMSPTAARVAVKLEEQSG